MARAIVTGLDRYRFRDEFGTLRSAPKGREVELTDAEYARALEHGWVTPIPGEEPPGWEPRFKAPRGWKHRPSLWFIVPAKGRLELATICLGALKATCADLTRRGIDASAVVIADDENLDIARGLGFAAIERENVLGAKLNDGYQAAAENDVDFAVPIGNDDLVDAGLIAENIPAGASVTAFRRSAIVSEDGRQLARLLIPYEGGDGVRIWPLRLFAPCGWRPAGEGARRALDGSTQDGAREKASFRFDYRETDGLQIVDFKTAEQLNTFGQCASDFAEETLGDPFAVLAATGYYSTKTLRALASFYGAA